VVGELKVTSTTEKRGETVKHAYESSDIKKKWHSIKYHVVLVVEGP